MHMLPIVTIIMVKTLKKFLLSSDIKVVILLGNIFIHKLKILLKMLIFLILLRKKQSLNQVKTLNRR